MAGHSSLPPIPPIVDGDLTLSIFTHRSLGHQSPNDINNSERLANLGERVLHLAVTDHLFRKNPILSAEQIEAETRRIFSDENYQHWIDGYGLRRKLLVNPNIQNPLDDAEELKRYFHSYVAAVFLQNKMIAVNDWISQLIDPENPPPVPDYTPQPPHYDAPPPSTPAPPLPSNPPQSFAGTSGPSLITLSGFHEYAAKNSLKVTYQAQSEGQSHVPIWTVRCFVNGEEKGLGQGKNQKAAKEEAVKRAWMMMGL